MELNADSPNITIRTFEKDGKMKPPLIHTNGFMRFYIENLDKLSDGVNPPQGEYFLHVWSKAMPNSTPELEIHDHPFSFQSEILDGEMTQEIYNCIIDPKGEYLKITPRPGKRLHRVDENRYRLEVKETMSYQRGDVYYMDQDSVHRITSYKDGCVTKVVRYTDQQHCPIVFLHESYWPEYALKDDPMKYIGTLAAEL